jgi:hypothetical protein
MEQSSKLILKNLSHQLPAKPSNAIISNETSIIRRNRTFESQLTSWSNYPIFILGDDVFIAILVSLPVCRTIPKMKPYEAATVFAQIVFSKPNPSLTSFP